jgi:hypothetical protein
VVLAVRVSLAPQQTASVVVGEACDTVRAASAHQVTAFQLPPPFWA